jgi:galactokinase
MELIRDTMERFRGLYGNEPSIVVTAPGRVNLIGEHTDYNQGFVLPFAIDRSIMIAASNRDDDQIHIHTVDLQSSISSSFSHLTFDSESLWSNYAIGVAAIFRRNGYALRGANFCLRGNIPIAAGLSSSAAIEVASAFALNHLNNLSISIIDLIKVAHAAETDFVGVHCGIMDQFVSVMGTKDHALFLDCRSLEYQHLPFPRGIRVIVCDTGVRRELARSAYNQRQAECGEAVCQLSKQFPKITSLRDVTREQLSSAERALAPILWKRVLHVVSENERVLMSVEAMKRNDLLLLGSLMTRSHESLRDNFEVSCKELDSFVEIALDTDGVYGARMTGAGFGGSAICLVADTGVDDLIEHLRTEYPRRAGRSLTVYLSSPSDGASVIFPRQSLAAISVAQLS